MSVYQNCQKCGCMIDLCKDPGALHYFESMCICKACREPETGIGLIVSVMLGLVSLLIAVSLYGLYLMRHYI